MALTSCPDCGGSISDRADQCPKCGWRHASIPVTERDRKSREGTRWALYGCAGIGCLGTLVGLLLFLTYGGHRYRPTSSSSASESSSRAILLAEALKRYATENDGRFPATLDELRSDAPNGHAYVADEEILRDAFGRGFHYIATVSRTTLGLTSEARITSFGADGAPGGEGPDADSQVLFLIREQGLQAR